MKLDLFSCQRNKNYCKTANFHVLVILTNLTNEKNLLKLQLVKVSSQNCQKRNWAMKAEILIKSGDGNTWTPLVPVDRIKRCVDSPLHLFLYHILFNNKHNILHYITNLPCIEQMTDYSNLNKSQFQCLVQTKEAPYRIIVNNNHQRWINYTVGLVFLYLN